MHCTETQIHGLYLGKSKDRWAGRAPSAIDKQSTSKCIYLGALGFIGDEQADMKVHGGTEKAVHHYAFDHYSFWNKQFNTQKSLEPGSFGENIAIFGVTESSVCIGDIFQLGNALVQVSQGRQPCWKLNLNSAIENLAQQFQRTANTGKYYRVLEEGSFQAGQSTR